MSPVAEYLIGGLVPDVGPLAAVPAHHGLTLEFVVGQDAEGGYDVLFEILVLVVSPNEHQVGIEGVYLGPPDQTISDETLEDLRYRAFTQER